MKQFFVLLLAGLTLTSALQAQDDYLIRPSEIGISMNLYDFETAQRIRSSSLSSVLANKQWAKLGEMTPGMGLHYFKGIRKLLDFGGTFSIANIDYPFRDKPNTGVKEYLLALDGQAYFKMVPDNYWVQPFASLGVGGHKWGQYWGVDLPMGLGLNVNFYRDARLFIHSQYRVPVTTGTSNNHFFYAIGITGRVGKKKEPPAPPPPPPADTDGDGILDPVDKCPTVPGVPKYDGCPVPDTDKDGINDDNDKCPTVPGLAKYQGCPIPDTDKDGINDEEDKCPNEPGVARYQGCPVPDRDKDGVNDEEDKCPDTPGLPELQGCPPVKDEVVKTVESAAKQVYFAFNSAKLLSRSFAPLDEVVKIMQENPSLNLTIEGHTDNVGADDVNQQLSEGRADAVKNYLVSKGVDAGRIESEGFGETKPIADNKTSKGRSLNRRVEMKISN
jgi:outer membrane protein OmpA-like peptidoglycan-associated protein